MLPTEPPEAPPIHHRRYRAGRWRHRLRRVVAVLLVLGVLALLFAGPSPTAVWNVLRGHLESWQGAAARNPVPAVVGFFLAVAAVTSLPLPVYTLLSLLAGALFGTFLGSAVASLGYAAGVTVCFLVARWFLRARAERLAGRWIGRVRRGVARDGAYYVLTLRLIPSLPFFLISVMMALTPMRTGPYALASWLGVIPFTFICAGLGTELASIESPARVLSPGVVAGLLALAALPMLLRKLLPRLRPGGAAPEPT